ncbi:MAG: tripartite tricarboxylate transporter substrate binding protein [Betaproteobacteria bacterium]|nr:tripartite tricarboxylate transporter substrate binding protein [Betaproteobacteria bacterium]
MRSVLAIVAATLAFSALAQPYPSKPIKWIVPFPPGGPTDTFSRAAAQKLAELVGQSVVIENRAGAGAAIGMELLAKSPPDGYTVGLSTTGSHTINPHLYAKLAYDPVKDFAPITLAISYVNVLVVNPSLPIHTGADLIAWARANPGKATFGSAGNGSSNHLFGEVLRTLTGAPMQHVPYKGSAPALTDVIAGNLTFMFDILNASGPQIRAGRVRGIAVASAKRTPYLPEIPTLAESGIKGFEEVGSDLWFGIMAPAGTPKTIVDKLNGSLIGALRSADMRERVRAQSLDLWTSTPEEFAAVIKADLARWGKMVKASGARVD